MTRTATRDFGAMFAVLLMVLGIFTIPASVSAAPLTQSDGLTTASGTTTDFGGGDYFYVKFGSDAAFGVVWGTDANVNNLYFVAIKARYLGMAQVYDSEDNLVSKNETIKIWTLYAVKLEDLLEFNDTNGNGLLQGHRVYQNGNFTGDYVHWEPMFKKVDLKTAWEQSTVTDSQTDDTRTWSFDLTAKDLPYVPLDNYTGATGDDRLNNLTLTFHLSARLMQVDNVSLPQWRITVQRGMMGNMMWFTDVNRLEDMRVSGQTVAYNVKWDQMISGWDYDSADANPSLLMEFGAIVGNVIPSGMAVWMGMTMIRAMNEAGIMTCASSTGDVAVDGATGTYSTPRPLASPRMTFGGDRTRIGALEWVSNVSVDGNQMLLHAQIMGGVPVWGIGANGAVFMGFAVLGGITYPGGDLIVHDPTFSSEAFVIGDGSSGLPGVLLLVAAMVAFIVVIVAVALVLTDNKKPGQKAQQNYERTVSSQPGEWAKYYNKK